jgi:hypothetical protein
MSTIRNPKQLRGVLDGVVASTPVLDVHTHLYDPAFGDLLLWGVDDLLTYHYLISEYFRVSDQAYDAFWALPKPRRADAIWKALFLDRSPLSEACRGVLTVFDALGIDLRKRDLRAARKAYAAWKPAAFIDRVFEAAGLRAVVMTNDPFDDAERPVWERGYKADSRFLPALRIDPVLLGWERSWKRLADWGYRVGEALTAETLKEIGRFFREWALRTKGLYVGVSLPPEFRVPDDGPAGRILEGALLPVCEELGLPLALMIGVRRQVNPQLRMAGDAMGRGSVEAVEELCRTYPRNKFMATFLSRENQHQACVAARKFRNLLPFGCWWFVNNPSIIEEITLERVELLGTSFIPQHSDARILDQVLYKWAHSRKIVGDVLFRKYSDLLAAGWVLQEKDLRRDVEGYFGGNFDAFLKKKL